MLNGKSLMLVAVVLSAAGCTTMTPPAAPAAVAMAAVATAPPPCQPASNNKVCDLARDPVCKVKITLQGPTPDVAVDPMVLLVKGEGKAHIVWELPPGAKFVAAQADGIFWYDDKDQFGDNYPTDDPNGWAGDGKKGKHYHWKFDNSIKSEYGYSIRFRIGNQSFSCDPTINNQAAF